MSISESTADTVYLGTSWNPESKGVYAVGFNAETGEWSGEPEVALEWESPGILLQHPRTPVLYASGGPEGEPQDGLSALEITGNGLRRLKTVSTGGSRVTHAAIAPSGKFLVTADYQHGSVAVFPIDAEGMPGQRDHQVAHGPGAGSHPRQERAHPHYVAFSPGGNWVIVPDLGANALFVYPVLEDPPFLGEAREWASVPNAGPRHMKFSPDGRFAWVLNELDLTVTTFHWDEESGILERHARANALPKELAAGEIVNTASEIQVHPSGKFLYTGNRGNDSVSVFTINPEDGSLTRQQVQPIRGDWPRHFALHPSGKWLLCAARHSNSVAVFSINPETGTLTYMRQSVIHVPGPTWVEIRRG
jgi:6-phosphogluconolactonase